jgi:hypothetical protein
MVAGLQGTLVSDKAISVDGPKGSKRVYPGRELEIITSQKIHLNVRLFLVGDSTYQLLFVRDEPSTAPFKRMVSTFSLL